MLGSTSSRGEQNDTLIYLINYIDNDGFASISAKRCQSPVIAVIDKGNYQEVKDSDNPGFNMFMDMAIEYVKNESVNSNNPLSRDSVWEGNIGGFETIIEEKIEIDTLLYSYQAPKLGNQSWGQEGVEGSFCPNKIAGCGPLAIAMVLSYYKIPTWIGYTYPNADVASENLNWDLINNHLPNEYGNCYNCPFDIHNSISRVLREIGHRADTKYKEEASSTSESNTKKILQKYLPMKQVGGYSDFNENGVKSAITNGLALISGRSGTYSYSKFEEDGSGHFWIADGYRFLTRQLRHYQKRANELVWKYVKTETEHERLFHFNWGWNGFGNGYYSGTVFCVIGHKKDPETGTSEITRDYYSNAKYLSIE